MTLSKRQWIPILHQLLLDIQDIEELAIRASAALGMRRFVDVVANHAKVGEEGEPWCRVFQRRLLPALKNGLRSRAEPVRGEVLGVLAHAVQMLSEALPGLEDMKVRFFYYILHVSENLQICSSRCYLMATPKLRSSPISSTSKLIAAPAPCSASQMQRPPYRPAVQLRYGPL